MPGRYRGSSDDQGSVRLQFELFEDNVVFVDGKFPAAIVNVTGLFENNDIVAITDEFVARDPNISIEEAIIVSEDPITLDLIPKFVPATNTRRAQIEYTFVDIEGQQVLQEALERSYRLQGEQTLEALTLIVRDRSDDPGFQFFPSTQFLPSSSPNRTITFEQASDDAVSDINFILDNDLLGSFTDYRVQFSEDIFSGDYITGNTAILTESGEGTIIQAEDLNLDTYQVETIPSGGQVISLLNASGLTGIATLNISDFSIAPGRYDLVLSVFDENDGEAQLQILLNGSPVKAAGNPIMLTENTSSGFPTEDVRREFVIEGIEITNRSNVIDIIGTADNDPRGGEWARVDFLTFIASDT